MVTPLETHIDSAITATPPNPQRPEWTSVINALTGIVTCLAFGCGLVWWLAASYAQLGEIRIQFDQLRGDIRNYNAEINKRLDDHESRLRAIEMRRP